MKRTGLNQRGAGLVVCILSIAVFAIMAGTLYALARTQVRESIFQLRQIQAHYIAEAGLEAALHELQTQPPQAVQFDDKPFAGGSFTVSVSTIPPIEITSTGHSPNLFAFGAVSRTIRVKLLIRNAGPLGADHVTWVPGSWTVGQKRQ